MYKIQKIKRKLAAVRGLTALEMLVATVIFATAIFAVHSSFLVGDASFHSSETKIIATSAARLAMENITRELRSGLDFTVSTDKASIIISKDDAVTVTVSWQNSGENANQVLKNDSENGTTIIGNHITALSFTDHTKDTEDPEDPRNAITVELTATGDLARGPDIHVSLKEQVNLRLL